MKGTLLFLAALVLATGSGCGAKKKEIASLDRKKAAAAVSEAEFALTVREYQRAEGLYAQAAALCPDTGDYWVSLGSTRMKLGQRDGAKSAYKSALAAYEDAARQDKTDPAPVIQQMTVLALLGRADDARSLLEKLPARFPDNRQVKNFVEAKQLDRLLADPRFKEVAL
ncbi:MAG TPA: tetratricopeptide repeat protein [Opitutaceae bacterium]|nr:tetratricopeptide repeat protein [Opitutaceae bacterium]